MKKLGHYNLIQTDAGWHSTLCAGNNKILFTSVRHEQELEWRVEYDIDLLQEHSIDPKLSPHINIQRRISKDKKHYFVLCMSDIVGDYQNTDEIWDYWISETYNTKQSMERGIKSVLANAKTTDVRIVDRRTKK